jgi:transposase InsO family protein
LYFFIYKNTVQKYHQWHIIYFGENMPFKEQTVSEQRLNLVNEIIAGNSNISAICRKYGVSRPTAYLWLQRYHEGKSMDSLSRAPKSRPSKTDPETETLILKERDDHSDWGARKLKAHIEREKGIILPASSTIHSILQRNNKITPEASQAATKYVRFERENSNDLWQCDYKGEFKMSNGAYCYPLSVADDRTRYNLCLEAMPGMTRELVEPAFLVMFDEYGLPDSLLCDNGTPWGTSAHVGGHTKFEVFLMNYNILPIHIRFYRCQTQGKIERLNRTIESGVVKRYGPFKDLASVQIRFDAFRDEYNNVRPHKALGMKVPSDVYQKSKRQKPVKIYEWEYSKEHTVRTVHNGSLQINGVRHYFSKGFNGQRVGIKASGSDKLDIIYRNFCVAVYDLRKREFVTKKIKRVKKSDAE